LVIDIDRLRDFRQEDIATRWSSRINYNEKRVYVDGLSKQQVEGLPEYNDRMTVDYDYEEQVGVYRPQVSTALAPATYDRDTTTTTKSRL